MSKIVIFTGPSGAGKSTLEKFVRVIHPELKPSISATTRKRRLGEVDGKDYYFLSVEEFKRRIENDEFIEWEEVYEDKFYGTLKSEVKRIFYEGFHASFDVDVKGAVNLKKSYGKRALLILVKPPSIKVLEQRLLDRESETVKSLSERLAKAKSELSFASFSKRVDHVLVNNLLHVSKTEAQHVAGQFLNRIEY